MVDRKISDLLDITNESPELMVLLQGTDNVKRKNNLIASVNPSITSDSASGYSVGSIWINRLKGSFFICSSAAIGDAIWVRLGVSPFGYNNYISGNWYVPEGPNTNTTGSPPSANNIRMFRGVIRENITISQLGCRVVTAAASSSIQLAVYAMKSNERPGLLLGKTGSISGAAAGALASNLIDGVAAPTTLFLPAGPYWFAWNCDNSTLAPAGIVNTGLSFSQTMGSATLANTLGGSGACLTGLNISGKTFGTWPTDCTNETLSEITNNATPLVAFKVN